MQTKIGNGLANFYRVLTNTIFLVPLQVRRFKAENPEAQVLAAGATKARKMPADAQVQYGAGWIVARRGTLILTNDQLVCGSWIIPLSTITSATLMRVNGFFAKAIVLKITAADEGYQFGLQYDPAWENQTALKFMVEDGKIGFSLFSIVARLIVLYYIVSYLIDKLT